MTRFGNDERAGLTRAATTIIAMTRAFCEKQLFPGR
jgi:hypothetical protein